MKRYVHPIKNWIEITLHVIPENKIQDIAAVTLKHPNSKFKLTDEELQIYEDFVESTLSILYGHDFKIIKDYQSRRSYAYYINFYPVSKDGEILDLVKVIFRIAEHEMKHGEEGIQKDVFIKSFTINNITYDKIMPFRERVSYLCDRLQEGDYDQLLTKPTEFE